MHVTIDIMINQRYVHSILLSLLLLLLSACAGGGQPQLASANVVASLSGPADEAFARAYEPMPFTFPADHGAHPEYKTEWWYYTGNLADATGNQYGYQLTFFRSALTPDAPERQSDLATNQIYMAHFALTDGNAQRHRSFERFSRGAGALAGATGDPAFRVWLEDWSVEEIEPDLMRLQAHGTGEEGEFAVDLTLRETQPPLLHGDQGLSQKGPEAGNASYYYSLIGLDTRGSITSGGRTIAVGGKSWMDHEFGTSALSENAVGWDWFSVQLDNGAALMFAQVRTDSGGVVPDFEGTYRAADGTEQPIGAADFTVSALDEWTSPRSGIAYPSGWQIDLPALEVSLTLDPLVRDQEMDVSFVYWEGAVMVDGTVAGTPVQGVGYVELTGYGQASGAYQR
jgi:predicted secreted hydrolase